jgi:hypothetical protein
LRYNDDEDAETAPDLDAAMASEEIAAGPLWSSLSPKSDGTVMRYLL